MLNDQSAACTGLRAEPAKLGSTGIPQSAKHCRALYPLSHAAACNDRLYSTSETNAALEKLVEAGALTFTAADTGKLLTEVSNIKYATGDGAQGLIAAGVTTLACTALCDACVS
jgi:hypothetical protein